MGSEQLGEWIVLVVLGVGMLALCLSQVFTCMLVSRLLKEQRSARQAASGQIVVQEIANGIIRVSAANKMRGCG